MDCQRVRESMFRGCDNELDPELFAPFHQHLSFCPGCAQEFAYLRKLVEVIRVRCCRDAAPVQLKVRILASFPHRGGLLQEALE
jgi:mycothiol system anti-sigma-R factor